MNSSCDDSKKKTKISMIYSKGHMFEVEDSVVGECLKINPYLYEEEYNTGNDIPEVTDGTGISIKLIKFECKRDDDDAPVFIDLMDYEDDYVKVVKEIQVSHKTLFDLIMAAT